jgi:hypothetical protein
VVVVVGRVVIVGGGGAVVLGGGWLGAVAPGARTAGTTRTAPT